MSTSYFYELNDGGLTIEVVDETLVPNTWKSSPEINCLVIDSGIVSVNDEGIACKTASTPYDPVLTLLGASWSSKVGDTGAVDAQLVNGCLPTAWALVRID